MNKLVFKHWILSCILVSFFSSLNTVNADENSFGYRIFEIQKKHALKGSTLAQYKLGTFYEFGISVKPDPQEAILWYKKAAKKRNKPAANRLTYLDIKLNGYSSSHNQWLNKIEDEVRRGNIHSTIILGQLNHYGLGVKKNLPAALKLLNKASVNGHTEIDFEIDNIKSQLAESRPKPEAVSKKIKEEPKAEVKAVAKKAKPKSEPKSEPKSKKVSRKKSSNKKSNAEKELIKRKKYEKAMRKQYREQLILQQQQDWSEGEDWVEDTDEDKDEN